MGGKEASHCCLYIAYFLNFQTHNSTFKIYNLHFLRDIHILLLLTEHKFFKLSTQEIPSTCQGTFSYTIQQTPYPEGTTGVNNKDHICGNSTCDVYVNQDAHRLHLTVFDNEHLLGEDSVYVPAIGESEF